MGTLTQFRKDLTQDDLSIIQQVLKAQIKLLKEEPDLIVEKTWSSFMKRSCKAEGKTDRMIEFYIDQYQFLLDRVQEARQ